MIRLKNFKLFTESKKYSNKNIISEICISMLLINNEFLDNILDRGLKSRYTENSQIFLTDLKNILLAKNRLKLGKFIDNRCVEDEEISKVNNEFEFVDFDIENDWNILIDARIAARSIIDKLLPDDKLDSNYIKNVYWIGPNKDEEYKEDIVIELNNEVQYSFFLNKNLSNTKTASFNKFADDLIGNNIDKLYKENYIDIWDKLAQEWVKLIYNNVNNNIKEYIEKFIDPNRIDSIGFFNLIDIKHSDKQFKYLGEYMPEFNRNILKLTDLLNETWKKREDLFIDLTLVENEWSKIKRVLLNSKILENLLTTSLKSDFPNFVKRTKSGLKIADGVVKMKLMKTIVEKMDCLERNLFYIDKKGKNFYILPSREFFRENYNNIDILFDYHIKFSELGKNVNENDFKIYLKLKLYNKNLLDMDISIKTVGGELSEKLSAKYKFNFSDKFNYLISKNLKLNE